MNYSTYTWDLVWALELVCPACYNTPGTFIDSICPKVKKKKSKNPEMILNFQQMVLYCPGLCTQTSGLRKVALGPSPKSGSAKIIMLK